MPKEQLQHKNRTVKLHFYLKQNRTERSKRKTFANEIVINASGSDGLDMNKRFKRISVYQLAKIRDNLSSGHQAIDKLLSFESIRIAASEDVHMKNEEEIVIGEKEQGIMVIS